MIKYYGGIKMRKGKIFTLIFCILMTSTFTYANSGPTYWRGYPSYEILTIEENSPIKVLNEDLMFDFTKDEFLEYNGYHMPAQVTAKYTMLNTSETNEIVQMAFPFISYMRDFRPEAINIKMNNKEIPFEVFIGDEFDAGNKTRHSEEELDFRLIIESISSGEYVPTNYNLDDIGTLYTYDIVSEDDEDINIKISYNYDNERSRIISKGFNGYEGSNGMETLSSWVINNEKLEMFVLGEEVNFDFAAYLDGEGENETDNYSLKIKTEDISIGEYLDREMELFKSEFNYLDKLAGNQFSNIITKLLDEQIEMNVVNLSIDGLFSMDYIERFFVLVYSVEFQPNSTNDISITYNSIGTMDRTKTADPIYTFNYILNPAKNWESFKNLNIEIKPPEKHPYIIDSSVELIRGEDGVYTGSFETLPEEDLLFSLYYNEKISVNDKIRGIIRSNYYLFIGLIPWAFGILIGIVYRRLKNNKKIK